MRIPLNLREFVEKLKKFSLKLNSIPLPQIPLNIRGFFIISVS